MPASTAISMFVGSVIAAVLRDKRRADVQAQAHQNAENRVLDALVGRPGPAVVVVSVFAVAEVTVPTALLLKVTVLLLAMVSKPKLVQ